MSKMNKTLLVSYALTIMVLFFNYKISIAQDKIQFFNDSTIEAFVIKVTDNSIKAYSADGKSIQTIDATMVQRIVYKNGKILILTNENDPFVQPQKSKKEESKKELYQISSFDIKDVTQDSVVRELENTEIRFGTIVQTEAPSNTEMLYQEEKREYKKTGKQGSCIVFRDKRTDRIHIGHYRKKNLYSNRDRRKILDSAIGLLREKLINTAICDKYSNFSKIEIDILTISYLWDDSKGSFYVTKGRTVTEINVIYYLNDFAVKNESFYGTTELHKLNLNKQLLMFEKSIDDLIKKMEL